MGRYGKCKSYPFTWILRSLVITRASGAAQMSLDPEPTYGGAPLTWRWGFSPATGGARGPEGPPPQPSTQVSAGLTDRGSRRAGAVDRVRANESRGLTRLEQSRPQKSRAR
jgi:hypothetical protein